MLCLGQVAAATNPFSPFLRFMKFSNQTAKHAQKKESGIYIGNQIDKAQLSNPIARKLVERFDASLFKALDAIQPSSFHEVGCGEGRLAAQIAKRYDVPVLATDFSEILIKENMAFSSDRLQFSRASIYELNALDHAADCVVCCEVMEHLERPCEALRALGGLRSRAYVFSVPREPIWRIINMARGQYWRAFGNTPGHLNHWSKRQFARLLDAEGFEVVSWLNPFPWLMAHFRVKPGWKHS